MTYNLLKIRYYIYIWMIFLKYIKYIYCRSQKSCRKPYIVQNPKSGLPHTFFLFTFVCIYTNKYNILCRFYVILFVHFYIKKYNSVPLYFISFFNFDILLNFDAIKYNGTLLYFLM